MMLRALLFCALLACVCLQVQAGGGQIFADRIEPVKNGDVTFGSPIFSPDAVLGDVTAETLVVLKQFELQIPVEDVILSGADGIAFNGNLGSAINVASGDATFDAVNGDVSVSGTKFDFDSTDDVNVSSDVGDVALAAALNAEFVSGGLNFNAANGGIDLSAAGDIQLGSRNGVVLNADNTLALQNEENVDLIVGGDVEVTSGGQFILSAGAGLSVDSTQAVELRSNHDLSLVTGGDFAAFRGQQIDLLALNGVAVDTGTFSVAAEEEIRLVGGSVCSNVRQVLAEGRGIASNIQANADEINLCANSQVSLTASGLDAFVHIDSSDSFGSSSTTASFSAGNDVSFGHVATASISFAVADLSAESDTLHVHADEDTTLFAGNDLNVDASDDVVNIAINVDLAASDEFSIISDTFYIETPVGDHDANVHFRADSSSLEWTAETVGLASYEIEVEGDSTLSIVADDMDVTSNKRESIFLEAEGRIELSVADDISSETTQLILGAFDTIGIELDESFLIEVGSFEASTDADFDVAGTGTVSLSTSGDISLAATNIDVSSSDNLDISASDTILLNTDEVSFTSSGILEVDADENLYWEFEDLVQVNGDEVTITVQSDAYFKASQILFSGSGVSIDADDINASFDSISINGGDISITSNNGNVDFVSAAGVQIEVEGDIALTADDVVTTAIDTHTFSAGGKAAFDANGRMSIAGQGTFDFSSAAGAALTAASDVQYLSPELVSFDSGDTFAASAASEVRFLDGTFQSMSGRDTAITAFGDIDTIKGAASSTVDTVSLFGSNLDFNAAELIIDANDDISIDVESITLTGAGGFVAMSTSETNLGGTDVTVSTLGPSSLSGAELTIESGENLSFTVTAARDIVFDAGADAINTNSDTNAYFNADSDIELSATNDVSFSGSLDVSVTSNSTIDVEGLSSITINPIEDLTFGSGDGRNITFTSSTGSSTATFGRNVFVVANGIDATTMCGISLTTEQNDAFGPLATQTFGSFGTPYGGNTGNVEVLARDGIQFLSLDPSVVNGGTDLPTSNGDGNILSESEGHTFFHSQQKGIIAHSVGSSGDFGILIETLADEGNVELLARSAYVKLDVADASLSSRSADVSFVTAEGFSLLAETDAVFNTAADLSVHAANGITFSSNGATISGDTTQFEVQDAFLMQQYGTEGTGGISFVTERFEAEVNDGGLIRLTAASSVDMTTTDGDARFTTMNGQIALDADVGTLSLFSEGAGDVSIDTFDGPISLSAGGANGSVTVEGLDFEFTSGEGSIHMFSQGRTAVTAGSDFNVNADPSVAPLPGHCLLMQTERPNDSISLTGSNRVRIAATAQLSENDALLVAGNNIDLEDNGSVIFNIQDLFEVGSTQSPGGEPSYQPLVRVVAGGAGGTPGFALAAGGDIDIESVNTLNTESLTATTINAQSSATFFSNGGVQIVSQGTAGASADVTVTSNAGTSVSGTVVSQTAPDNYLVTAINSLFVESSGDGIGDSLSLTTEEIVLTADTLLVDSDIHRNTIAGGLTFAADAGNILITSSSDAGRPSLDDAEHGSISLSSSSGWEVVSTADSISFNQLSANGRLELSSETVTVAASNDFALDASSDDSSLLVNADDIVVTATTSLLLSAAATGNTYYYDSPNALPEDNGDILLSASLVELTGVDVQVTANGNFTAHAPEGTITLSSMTDVLVDFSGVADNSALLIDALNDVTFTAAGILSITPNLDTPITQFEDFSGYVFSSESDLQLSSAVSIAATGDFIEHLGRVVELTPSAITLTAADDFRVIAGGHGSFIEIVADAAASSFTALGSIEFDALGGGVFLSAAEVNVVADTQASFATTFGDVRLDTDTMISITSTDVVFAASGIDGTGDAGLRLTTSGLATFDSDSIFLDGREHVDVFAANNIGFTSDDLEIYAFNTECDLELIGGGGVTLGGTSIALTTTNFEVSGNSAALSSDGTIAINTSLDGTDIYITTDEPGVSSGGTIEFTSQQAVFFAGNDALLQAGDNDNKGYLELTGPTFAFFGQGGTFMDPISDAALQIVADSGPLLMEVLGSGLGLTNSVKFTARGSSTTINAADALQVLGGGTLTIESDHGRVRILEDAASGTLTFSAPDVLIETVGYGLLNDIVMSSPDDLVLSSAVFNVQATGSDGAINMRTASGLTTIDSPSIVVDADSGVRFLLTENSAFDTLSLVASSDVIITTMDLLDDIFFQSDFRTSFNAFSAGRKISHTNYNYRLGFFSVNPSHVRHVQYQTSDGCLSGGWCGMTNLPSVGNANAALQNIASVAETLRTHLRNFGLIAWKHPTV